MTPEQKTLLHRRKQGFPLFYEELIPSLVDFVGAMGISPAHQVLNHAPRFAPLLSAAIRDLAVVDEQDRVWLLARLGYFIGEYFAQKYAGAWYVNEDPASRFFARYVVGKFDMPVQREHCLDPCLLADACIAAGVPRSLEQLLDMAEKELFDFG